MQWGSENDKHGLQPGDQEDVSKLRTAYRFQYTKTKIFSILLLGGALCNITREFQGFTAGSKENCDVH